MSADARRLCRTVAAVIVFPIMFAGASEAGTISLDTAFQGSAVGYELESTILAFQIHEAFAVDGLGSVRMSQASGVDGIGFAEVFEAYCVDIMGPIFDNFSPTANPPVEVTAFGDPMTTWSDPSGVPVPLGNAAAAASVASLYNQFNPLIEGLVSGAGFSFASINTTADVARTALALSIWNTLYDGDDSVSFDAGTFYVWCDPTSPGFAGCDRTNATRFGNIVLLANAFMATPVTGSTDATWIQLTNPGPSGTDIQDFVGPVRGGSTQSVPEPSSLALLGIGLIATAVAKRRRVLEKF